jgi:hypothetical protein
MEKARSCLAVAIAAENKTTPRAAWRTYLATEDRMRRCVRELRRAHGRVNGAPPDWHRVLALLNQPLPEGGEKHRREAERLCRRLHDVLVIMENAAEEM